jgi:FkbM family methyltransferase
MAQKLSGLREQVYVLQIGAMDGISFDPIHALILQYNWHGLLVEPLPHHFQNLTKLYEGRKGLQLANIAIGHAQSQEPFYFIDPVTVDIFGLPDWVLGISSFFEQHIRDQEVFFNEAGFHNIMQFITQTSIQTTTLSALLQTYPLASVDVLQIDAEGFDYQILRQWDFTSQNPAIINIEFARLTSEDKEKTTALLLKEGYFLALQGLDMLALQPELLDAHAP